VPGNNFVGAAIVLGMTRIGKANIPNPVMRVVNGISPNPHDIGQKPICLFDGAPGIIDEQRLARYPLVEEFLALHDIQRVNIHVLHALLAAHQFRFSPPSVAQFDNRTVIFGTEAGAQMLTALPVADGPCDCQNEKDDNHGKYTDLPNLHASPPKSYSLFEGADRVPLLLQEW
jgi:hypothetical protein